MPEDEVDEKNPADVRAEDEQAFAEFADAHAKAKKDADGSQHNDA